MFIGNCKVKSFTVSYDLDHFFGDPIKKGTYKWEAESGDENCKLPVVTAWLEIRGASGEKGFIPFTPVTPESGKGYGMDVSSIPNWSELFHCDTKTPKNYCYTREQAINIYKNGKVTDFTITWDNNSLSGTGSNNQTSNNVTYSSSGYTCSNKECIYVTSGATFTTLNDCQSVCTKSICSFLEGTWVRVYDKGNHPCNGMEVKVEKNQGAVTYSPNGCCFKTGDIKFKNINYNNCVIDDMIRSNSNCDFMGNYRLGEDVVYKNNNEFYLSNIKFIRKTSTNQTNPRNLVDVPNEYYEMLKNRQFPPPAGTLNMKDFTPPPPPYIPNMEGTKFDEAILSHPPVIKAPFEIQVWESINCPKEKKYYCKRNNTCYATRNEADDACFNK
jgi:hypothetical protein